MNTALLYHLRYNCFTPAPYSMIATCERAIKKYNQGDVNSRVRLPDGITYNGKKLVPVSEVINDYFLEFFLDEEYEDY